MGNQKGKKTFTHVFFLNKEKYFWIIHSFVYDIAYHNDKYRVFTLLNSWNLLFGSTEMMHSFKKKQKQNNHALSPKSLSSDRFSF